MTKREAFAMAAMQGILGNPLILDRHGLDAAGVADSALSFADALLSALNGEPRNG